MYFFSSNLLYKFNRFNYTHFEVNMDYTKQQPLSYVATKSVLKWMNFQKRQDIHCHIPSLRKTNELIPHRFERVWWEVNRIKLDDNIWDFSNGTDEETGEIIENKTKVEVDRQYVRGKQSLLNISPVDAFNKLLNAYIRNGTEIRHLNLSFYNWGRRSHQQRPFSSVHGINIGQQADNFKLKVSVFSVGNNEFDKKHFETFSQIIDENFLEHVTVAYSGNTDVFEKPLIKKCESIHIENYDRRPIPWDSLENLVNSHIRIFAGNQDFTSGSGHQDFSEIPKFMIGWLKHDRVIGSSFTCRINSNEELQELYNCLIENHGALVSTMANEKKKLHANSKGFFSSDANFPSDGLHIKIPQKSAELVFFTTLNRHRKPDTLTMQLMEAGTSTLLKRSSRKRKNLNSV